MCRCDFAKPFGKLVPCFFSRSCPNSIRKSWQRQSCINLRVKSLICNIPEMEFRRVTARRRDRSINVIHKILSSKNRLEQRLPHQIVCPIELDWNQADNVVDYHWRASWRRRLTGRSSDSSVVAWRDGRYEHRPQSVAVMHRDDWYHVSLVERRIQMNWDGEETREGKGQSSEMGANGESHAFHSLN